MPALLRQFAGRIATVDDINRFILVDTPHRQNTRAPREFSLVYLVYNAITCLLNQDQQVEYFRNAAKHIEPGGRFIIEVFVPDLQRLPPCETPRPFHVG